LQRHANRLFGFSAKNFDVAQALYEKHKFISCPRTDGRHLSKDVAETLPRIVKAIEAPYRARSRPVQECVRSGEVHRRFESDRSPCDHPDSHAAREGLHVEDGAPSTLAFAAACSAPGMTITSGR
jgi:DNA topoisomerase-3